MKILTIVLILISAHLVLSIKMGVEFQNNKMTLTGLLESNVVDDFNKNCKYEGWVFGTDHQTSIEKTVVELDSGLLDDTWNNVKDQIIQMCNKFKTAELLNEIKVTCSKKEGKLDNGDNMVYFDVKAKQERFVQITFDLTYDKFKIIKPLLLGKWGVEMTDYELVQSELEKTLSTPFNKEVNDLLLLHFFSWFIQGSGEVGNIGIVKSSGVLLSKMDFNEIVGKTPELKDAWTKLFESVNKVSDLQSKRQRWRIYLNNYADRICRKRKPKQVVDCLRGKILGESNSLSVDVDALVRVFLDANFDFANTEKDLFKLEDQAGTIKKIVMEFRQHPIIIKDDCSIEDSPNKDILDVLIV